MKYFLCLFSILSSVLFLQCGRFNLVENDSSYRKDSNFSKSVATDTLSMTDDAGPMPNVPGECYAKSSICKYEDKETKVQINYTSNNETLGEEHYEYVKVKTAPASLKWVKIKFEGNCLANDPEDCYVWCLKEVPEQYESIRSLKQDENIKFLVRDSIITKRYMTDSYNAWKSVICDDDLTEDLIQDIQFALNQKGYIEEPFANKYVSKIKNALLQFQSDNFLPVGQLDMETLEALGVEY